MRNNTTDIKQILLKYEFGNFVATNSDIPVDLDSDYFSSAPGIIGCFKEKSVWHVYTTSLESHILNKREHPDQLSAYKDIATRLGLTYVVNTEICSFYNHKPESLTNAERCKNMADLVEKVLNHVKKRNHIMKEYKMNVSLDEEVSLLENELRDLRRRLLLSAKCDQRDEKKIKATQVRGVAASRTRLYSKKAGNQYAFKNAVIN